MGGKRGGAGLSLPTCQVGAAVASLADLSAAIAAATLSKIAPVTWIWDAAHGKSLKQVYPMCHLLQKATPPRVGKATSQHIPRVFSPLGIR